MGRVLRPQEFQMSSLVKIKQKKIASKSRTKKSSFSYQYDCEDYEHEKRLWGKVDIYVLCPWNDGNGDLCDGMQLFLAFFKFFSFFFLLMTYFLFLFSFFVLSCSTAAAILRSLQEVQVMI